ncbi:MAG: acyl-CoA dehydrogenase family protein [Chloroflexi bacterium]|nr:acyl-CoA dehydrogenase family protein [Chloroflexota bacterium]
MKDRGYLFADEHDLFRSAVRSFVEREMVPRADEWEARGAVDRELYQKMGALGFLGIRYPAEYGGAEQDISMTVVFAEELARCRAHGVTSGVLVHTDMASPHLARAGTHVQKQQYLRPLISGERICAIAVTEPGAGSDVASLRTQARRAGDAFVLDGAKTFITNALSADTFVVAAKSDPAAGHRGISLFIVEKGTPGFTVARKLNKLGQHSGDTGELVFASCAVPAANLLGELHRGFYAIMQNFQDERLVIAIACYSGAQQVLEDTLRYVREREMFGAKLGDLQVTKHRLAQMATEIEAGRQLTYHAAWLYAQRIECLSEVSMSKAFCAEMANRVAYQALQLHGGYGYIQGYFVERFYRDVRVYSIAGGATEVMYEIIGKGLSS